MRHFPKNGKLFSKKLGLFPKGKYPYSSPSSNSSTIDDLSRFVTMVLLYMEVPCMSSVCMEFPKRFLYFFRVLRMAANGASLEYLVSTNSNVAPY